MQLCPGRQIIHPCRVKYWAKEFGKRILELTKNVTAIEKISVNYKNGRFGVKEVHGRKMVIEIAKKMEAMLDKKVKAVQKMAATAEKVKAEFKDEDIEYDYYNAKKLLRDTVAERLSPNASHDTITSEYKVIHLEENSHFNNISVNFSLSTFHVPTNVYDKAQDVVDGIAWTTGLDKQFAKNTRQDPTLTWQYFCSSTGIFRVFPGMIWPRGPKVAVDMFDCRVRGWYIQAATFPKDMIILLDSSGSMHGRRMSIALKTVDKILDTLSDNDFFNIILFNKTPSYLDNCLNGTLVQANADNRRRLGEALANVKTKYVANFELALIEAFELFEHTKNQSKGTGCYTNKVIMLVTDGAPENYEWVFKKYNWGENKTVSVRVFTYLIGREVSDSRQVRWMACVNKGGHTRISTMADVQENVQKYIKVLSRPTLKEADSEDSNVAWSPFYLDYIQAVGDATKLEKMTVNEGLRLMTSVAQPVFDRINKTLLGVVGTDVAISELTNLAPRYKMGVNGYAFAVTNNGYLLFHPELRPVQWMKRKPNYNSVVLTEVELGEHAEELKITMTNRETGSYSMTKINYEQFRRVSMRKTSYFVTAIGSKNIPFSLAIALPENYGLAYLDATVDVNDNISIEDLFWGGVEVSPWPYCENMNKRPESGRCLDSLKRYLEMGQSKRKTHRRQYKKKCDTEMVGSLLYDASVTRDIHRYWTANQCPRETYEKGWCAVDHLESKGVTLVFLGTRAGLTRFMRTTENVSEPEFVKENLNTVDDLYYKRAADSGGGVVFSIPIIEDHADQLTRDVNKTVVTASIALVLKNDKKNVSTIAAVLGYQMKYTSFQNTFLEVAAECPKSKGSSGRNCNFTCNSTELDCYLVDSNGFVVYANVPGAEGWFFSSVTTHDLFRHLIDEGIFQRIHVTDDQSSCEVLPPMQSPDSAAAGIMTTPFRWMYSVMAWTLREFAFFLAEWGLLTWFAEYHSVEAIAATLEDTDPQDYYDEQAGHFTHEEKAQWEQTMYAGWRSKCIKQQMDQRGYLRKETVHKPCRRNFTLYNADFSKFPIRKALMMKDCGGCRNYTDDCHEEDLYCDTTCLVKDSCEKNYAIQRVENTNLLLIAIDSDTICPCPRTENLDLTHSENFDDEESICYKLKESHHRKKQPCPSTLLVAPATKCGGSIIIVPCYFIMMQLSVLLFSCLLASS